MSKAVTFLYLTQEQTVECGAADMVETINKGGFDEMLAEVRRKIPPGHLTDDGKVIFSFHSYVVRTGRYNILVDTCCGNDKERPGRDHFTGLKPDYLDTLAAEGLKPEDIDYVIGAFPKVIEKLRNLSPLWDSFQKGEIESVV